MNEQTLILDAVRGQSDAYAFAPRKRVDFLKRYGEHPMAFSTMQPDMAYYDSLDKGYIAYARHWGINFALADPVCDPRDTEAMLDGFLAAHPNAVFAQVSQPVAEILHRKHGLYATQLGSESQVLLCDWDLRGSRKQIIRTAVNQAKAQGVEVREGRCEQQTRAIAEAWIQTRRCKSNEIRFLIRPMLMDYVEGTRYFYAYRGDEALGFVHFDPIYRDGRVVGYVPNISRACASFKQGLWYPMMVHAMNVFKSEGVEYLDMGLIPLMLDDRAEACESAILRMVLNVICRWGNSLYNFRGLAFAKSRFQGRVRKTYVCHRQPMPALAMVAMFRLTRLI
ncbi:MAG: DUF2156 domain-containing protein [Lysobacteraceae bacterium]